MRIGKKITVSADGFTLLEILIVIVIISIITAVAVMVFGDFGRGRREKIAADLLQRTIPIAQQQAILQPAIIGLAFTEQGYQFYQFWVDPKEHRGKWKKLIPDDLSRPRAFRDLNVSLKLLGKSPTLSAKENHQPKIIILPNGFVTPFTLTLSGVGEVSYKIQVTSNGSVKTEVE